MSKIISMFIALTLALSISIPAYSCSSPASTSPETRIPWDLTAFDDWCGEPEGTIRVIPAFPFSDTELQDDYGNIWEYTPSEPWETGALYIIWLDDMGTTEIEDDIILKLFKEVY